MSFPSRFPGRCATCPRPILVGEAIHYDKALKKAWHVGCPGPQMSIQQPGEEPGEPARPGRRRVALTPDLGGCVHCGLGPSEARPMVHVACADKERVPF